MVLSGNEDLGVRALTLELYGCEQAADTRAVCGDGLVFSPEQCDLGALEATGATEAEARAAAQAAVGAGRELFVLARTDATAQGGNVTLSVSANGADTSCSVGCTAWQPASCAQFGTCDPAAEEEPVGQDMPGKREVGSTTLPGWVTIADADFDAVFRALEASGDADTCTKVAESQTITDCPGNLKKYLNSPLGKYVCAPPFSSALRTEGAYSFYVSLPIMVFIVA